MGRIAISPCFGEELPDAGLLLSGKMIIESTAAVNGYNTSMIKCILRNAVRPAPIIDNEITVPVKNVTILPKRNETAPIRMTAKMINPMVIVPLCV